MSAVDNQTLQIEKPVYGGDCLSHLPAIDTKLGLAAKPGKAVFVPLTLPGEQVSVRLTEEKRTFAKAEIVDILQPDPGRVAPQCRHFGHCGGCHYQHANYPTQLQMKEQILRDTFTRIGVAIPAAIGQLAAEPWGYRNRIRLAVFLEDQGKTQIGYRSRGSHALIPVVECPIAAPALFTTAQLIANKLDGARPPISISEMELFTNPDESEILITLYCEPLNTPRADLGQWLEQVQAAIPAITGMRVLLSDGSLHPPIVSTQGTSELSYLAGNFSYSVEHGAFFQVNRFILDPLLALVRGNRQGGEAWDLYAGVGLFAQQLTTAFQRVTAVESAPASIKSLASNLDASQAMAIASTTLDFLRHNRQERQPRPDLIIVDPPRAGLGDEVTSLLNAIGSPSLVYVSCDPTTLAKDLLALTRERYRVDRITLVDMFPQTFHIETVVDLIRS